MVVAAEEYILPQELDAERFVLGHMLRGGSAIHCDVEPADFSLEKHRLIAQTVLELDSRGDGVSLQSVYMHLRDQGRQDVVGGLTGLSELSGPQLEPNFAQQYSRRITDTATVRKAMERAIRFLRTCSATGDTPDTLLSEAEQISQSLAAKTRPQDGFSLSDLIVNSGGLDAFLAPDKRGGIRLPFSFLDATLGHLRPSKYLILGAMPATGKTALAWQVAEAGAEQGKRVLFVSREMSPESLYHRAICGRARVSSYRFREGDLSESERREVFNETAALAELDDLLTVTSSANTPERISRILRKAESRGRPYDLVVIDYIQLLDSAGRGENRAHAITEVSMGLNRLKLEHGVHVFALSQLTPKQNSDDTDEPEASWLRDSRQLIQDADQIVLLWGGAGDDNTKKINWKVAKNRDGRLNRGTLNFIPKFARFESD